MKFSFCLYCIKLLEKDGQNLTNKQYFTVGLENLMGLILVNSMLFGNQVVQVHDIKSRDRMTASSED